MTHSNEITRYLGAFQESLRQQQEQLAQKLDQADSKHQHANAERAIQLARIGISSKNLKPVPQWVETGSYQDKLFYATALTIQSLSKRDRKKLITAATSMDEKNLIRVMADKKTIQNGPDLKNFMKFWNVLFLAYKINFHRRKKQLSVSPKWELVPNSFAKFCQNMEHVNGTAANLQAAINQSNYEHQTQVRELREQQNKLAQQTADFENIYSPAINEALSVWLIRNCEEKIPLPENWIELPIPELLKTIREAVVPNASLSTTPIVQPIPRLGAQSEAGSKILKPNFVVRDLRRGILYDNKKL